MGTPRASRVTWMPRAFRASLIAWAVASPSAVKLVARITSCTSFTAEGEATRSEEHTSELQSQSNLVCRLLLEKKKKEHLCLHHFRPNAKHRLTERVCTTLHDSL